MARAVDLGAASSTLLLDAGQGGSYCTSTPCVTTSDNRTFATTSAVVQRMRHGRSASFLEKRLHRLRPVQQEIAPARHARPIRRIVGAVQSSERLLDGLRAQVACHLLSLLFDLRRDCDALLHKR